MQFLLPMVCALGFMGLSMELGAGENAFDFGRVPRGHVVEHIFKVENGGESKLELTRVDLSRPLKPSVDFQHILPGETGALRVKLDTAGVPDGHYEGRVSLYADNSTPFAVFKLTGEVFSPIAITPGPLIFLASTRGESAVKSVTLVNQTETPFKISEVSHDNTHFSTRIEVLEEGYAYRLVVSISTSGPGGKNKEPLLISTSHPDAPTLNLAVHTYLRERVYTFPEGVDMGSVRVSDIRKVPELAARLSQTLMVYRKGSHDFEITAESDLQMLALALERGPEGDRYEITVSLKPETLVPGKIEGNITVTTNDPEFDSLNVPVTGYILNE